MEKLAIAAGHALGAESLDPPGWEWALVAGPTPAADWPPAMGAALAEVLRPGERLHLGARHLAIRMRDDALAGPELRNARTRIAAVRAALEGPQRIDQA